MSWLQRIFAGRGAGFSHIRENNTPDEKERRLATLSDEEKEAYKWLFEGYSEGWTTETLGLEAWDAKALYDSLYRKLGVGSPREILRYYVPNKVLSEKPPSLLQDEDDI